MLSPKHKSIVMAEVADLFREEFNRYKVRKPALDLSDAIDFTSGSITDVTLVTPKDTANKNVGLQPVEEWKIYHLDKHPGFYVILDPFLPDYKTVLIHQCLAKYPCRPNKTNLDAHGDASRPDSPFAEFVNSGRQALSKDLPLMKLRWTTLGYHYNWTSKEYSPEDHSPFPEDLASLTQQLAEGAGFQFMPQAAIVNYYHLKDNLGIHTDHSELDHQAPLVSISLGCSAIFLLGETRAVKPSALLLRCGDVCIMSGPSRLAYHAVPRILDPSTETSSLSSSGPCERRGVKRSSSSGSDKRSKEEGGSASDLQGEMQESALHHDFSVSPGTGSAEAVDEGRRTAAALSSADLRAISRYLEVSRININVRQVLKKGETFPKLGLRLDKSPGPCE